MFNVKKIFDAAKVLGAEKNISLEIIKKVIIQSLENAYIRTIVGNNQSNTTLPNPKVKIVLDEKKGTAYFYIVKVIKKDVTDDMLEIDLEDAERILPKKKLKYGDEIEIYDQDIDIQKLSEIFVKQFKISFQQQLNDEEKTVLYDLYKDRINEIVVGTVDKVENRGVTIIIGKNSVFLARKDMIGDETFTVGQQVKLYLSDVSDDKKNSIAVTRANTGFIKKILEEEIYEIYDGTIVIKNIVRQAGQRSKVAVYSNDKDVNATGSCIGKKGMRINKIVSQLGGTGCDKEKIDIINYSDNPSLYIIEALKPAEAIGIKIEENNDEKEKSAICVIKDGQRLKAVGLRGVNIRLASQLTGYKITVIEETKAKENGLVYVTKEELDAEENRKLEEAKKAAFVKQSIIYKEKNKEEIQRNLKKAQVQVNDINISSIKNQKENLTLQDELAKIKKMNNIPLNDGKKGKSKKKYSSLQDELNKIKDNSKKDITDTNNVNVGKNKGEESFANVKTVTNVLDLEKKITQEKINKKTNINKNKKKKIFNVNADEKNKKKNIEDSNKDRKMNIYTKEELMKIEKEDSNEEKNKKDNDFNFEDYAEYYDE